MKYFIGFFITIVLLVILIILLVGGLGTPRKAVQSRALSSYSTSDAVASVTIAGRINAQSLHSQVIISVDRNQVVYEQETGYDGENVKTVTFPNTENSYYAFLRALTVAGFNKGNTDKNLQNSQGICPLGQRYNFNLVENSSHRIQFWSTSCGSGTYGGNTSMTLTLFQAQVPGYDTLIQDVQF